MPGLPLPHTVSVELYTGQNNAGEPTFGTAVDYRCRFDRVTEYVRGSTSNEVSSDAAFIFEPLPVIPQKSRLSITVSGTTYTGTAVESTPLDTIDGDTHHQEVRTLSQ